MTRQEADEIAERRQEWLERELSQATSETTRRPRKSAAGIWAPYIGGPEKDVEEVDTSVDKDLLRKLLEVQTQLPDDFHPHPKIEAAIKSRRQMARGERPLDWSAGESLAFATLAAQGFRVRLSGQDSERGTFSHRHAVLHDVQNGKKYYPLQYLTRESGARRNLQQSIVRGRRAWF